MKTVIKLVIIFTLFSLSIVITSAKENPKLNENNVATLMTGIKSENEGLMRSAIFMAGKYKVEETIEVLLEVFESESDPSNLILVAMAIYRIGNQEAMMKVIEAANYTENMHAKNILSAISMNYLVENEIPFALR
ncbi:MAG: hypothetical protein C4543_09745 [Ignavibacteriales bacterium]|nr:hypothetical protein [Melioribacteraceae bacterium]RJP57467.1 MAG: hypothetical protein C4543_09745 [Ignavibacteriales bacterium]